MLYHAGKAVYISEPGLSIVCHLQRGKAIYTKLRSEVGPNSGSTYNEGKATSEHGLMLDKCEMLTRETFEESCSQVGQEPMISKIRLSKEVKQAYKSNLKSMELDDKLSSNPTPYHDGKAMYISELDPCGC